MPFMLIQYRHYDSSVPTTIHPFHDMGFSEPISFEVFCGDDCLWRYMNRTHQVNRNELDMDFNPRNGYHISKRLRWRSVPKDVLPHSIRCSRCDSIVRAANRLYHKTLETLQAIRAFCLENYTSKRSRLYRVGKAVDKGIERRCGHPHYSSKLSMYQCGVYSRLEQRYGG